MSIEYTLSKYDITRYSLRYCLVRQKYIINDTYEQNTSIPFDTLFRTRCLIIHEGVCSLLCPDKKWNMTDNIDDSMRAHSIRIQCDHVGHIFLCVYDEYLDDWLMISSYAGEYAIRYERIDIYSLSDWIIRIQEEGMDNEWQSLFSCAEGCKHSCIPYIEIFSSRYININNIDALIENIESEIEQSVQDESHYINSDEYRCLLSL